MTIQVDIFISGAGPIGLYFAYLMSSWGHSVYICDIKSGPTDQSRALLVTSRTLEILDTKGLGADILSESYIPSGLRTFYDGKLIGELGACGDTPFPHMTILPQGKTEQVLCRNLTRCKVHFNTELISYVQEDTRVISVVKDIVTQQEQTIESKYIIGADGSHSKVRKGNPDWTYEGVALKTKFALADLTVDTENIETFSEKTSAFAKGTKNLVFIRLPSENGYTFRVFGNLGSFEGTDIERHDRVTHGLVDNVEAPTLEFMQAWVDEMTSPQKFQLSNLIWSSYFRINERIANEYRRGNAFLVGDAAHCHSPAGGQGMNLGLQDADNLAWKLSQVLNGNIRNPDQFLDTYHEERYPHALSTIQSTGTGTRASIMDNAIVNTLRPIFMSTILKFPYLKQYAFKTILQQFLAIDPKVSSLLGSSDKGLLQPGQFLPEAYGLRKSYIFNKEQQPLKRFERWTLRELVSNTDMHSIILVATCPSTVSPNKDIIRQFWHDTAHHSKRFVIQSVWHSPFMKRVPDYIADKEAAEAAFFTEENMDHSHSVTRRVGLYPTITSHFMTDVPAVILIVRPDLYVVQAKYVYHAHELKDVINVYF